MDLKAAVDRYLLEVILPRKPKHRTLMETKGEWALLVEPFKNDTPVAAIQTRDIADWRYGMLARGAKSRVPGLSQSVFPRRDIWGEVITREGATGPDVLSPIFESRLKNDPVTRELIRLGVGPGRISDKIGDVELTAKQYDELQFLAGRYLRKELEATMSHPRYQTSVDADKIDGVRNIIAATRAQARAIIRKRYPTIDLRAAKAKMDRLGVGPGL